MHNITRGEHTSIMTSPLSIFFRFEAITKLSGKILFTTITVFKKIPNFVLDKSNDTKKPLISKLFTLP